MIDFVYRLNDVLPAWPQGAKWSLQELSQATATSIPHVLQYISEGLGKEIDITGLISQDEATEVLLILSKRLKPQIEERERAFAQKQKDAVDQFERLNSRVLSLQVSGNWYTAFRSLSYFAGQFENELPKEVLVNICSDIVRSGIKAKVNLQELAQWLQKGVAVALSYHSREGLEEALDLIDAYGEHFLSQDEKKGPLVVGNILAVLEEPAARLELWEQYKDLVNHLYP